MRKAKGYTGYRCKSPIYPVLYQWFAPLVVRLIRCHKCPTRMFWGMGDVYALLGGTIALSGHTVVTAADSLLSISAVAKVSASITFISVGFERFFCG
ncbi:MAG: hypothetical protein RR385_09250 [Clostridiales bacterium]